MSRMSKEELHAFRQGLCEKMQDPEVIQVRRESFRQSVITSPKATNTSGCSGVHKQGNKWIARITAGGERHYLGIYDTLEGAIRARLAAEEKYWGIKRGGNDGD